MAWPNTADYPEAQPHPVPRDFMFNSNGCKAIVIHKTAGDATPQAVYNTFLASGNPGRSVHYCVGQDGSIWQYVPEELGAGGNGITDSTMQPFWEPYVSQYGNLNLCTLSIEHCDPAGDNSTPLTPYQKAASFALVAYLAKKYSIAADHIQPHDSICATVCPGNYPLDELRQFVQNGGAMNKSQELQAQNTWNATTSRAPGGNNRGGGIFPAGKTPPDTTGIAIAWYEEYAQGRNWGPPLTSEYTDVDWESNEIVTQQFTRGRCEWHNGQAHWYGQPA